LKLINTLKTIWSKIDKDNITVFAAQGSFFVIISSVPFLTLFVSIISYFIPTNLDNLYKSVTLPKGIAEVIMAILRDLSATSSFPFLSFSAIATLWTASKGVAAVKRGIDTVYEVETCQNYVKRRIRSLINTLFFIIFLVMLITVLLFGSFITNLIRIKSDARFIVNFRFPIALLFMSVVFTVVFYTTSRRGGVVPSRLEYHLPGAIFSAFGWVIFSYVYSLYITYFPNASYIYGSLAAICLIMLWVYFCTIILLLGAEVNKFLYLRKVKKDVHSHNV